MNKKIPIASSTFSHGQEEVVLSAEESDGIVTFASYFESVDNNANRGSSSGGTSVSARTIL